MARIRTVKPEFWLHEELAAMPAVTRLAYIALWNHADDEGRMRAHPSLLRAALFPYEPDLDLESTLRPLVATGRLVYYEVGGTLYAHLPTFSRHQRVNRPQASRLPPPPAVHGSITDGSVNAYGSITDGSVNAHGSITESSVKAHGSITWSSVKAHGTITEPSLPVVRIRDQGSGIREVFTQRAGAHVSASTCAREDHVQPATQGQDTAPRLRSVWDGPPEEIPADVVDPPMPAGLEHRVVDTARHLVLTEAAIAVTALHAVYVEAVSTLWPGRRGREATQRACQAGLSRVLVWAARASREPGRVETVWQIARRMVVESVRAAGEYGKFSSHVHTLWGNERDGEDLVRARLGQLEAESRPAPVLQVAPSAALVTLAVEERAFVYLEDGVVDAVRRDGRWWADVDGQAYEVELVRSRGGDVWDGRRANVH